MDVTSVRKSMDRILLMAAEKVPEPLIKQEGVIVEHLSAAITLVPLIQCQKA